jgi:hypothetical protein
VKPVANSLPSTVAAELPPKRPRRSPYPSEWRALYAVRPRIYRWAFIDTYSKVAFAQLYDTKTADVR